MAFFETLGKELLCQFFMLREVSATKDSLLRPYVLFEIITIKSAFLAYKRFITEGGQIWPFSFFCTWQVCFLTKRRGGGMKKILGD